MINKDNNNLENDIINDDENFILNEELNESFIDDEFDVPEIENIKEDFNLLYQFHVNKHKREGKHSLKRDVIFKGKIDKDNKNIEENVDTNHSSTNNYKLESGSIFEFESKNNEEYVNQKQLSIDVFEVLSTCTDIDFNSNRRKPNKQSFNEYYILLLSKLRLKYTNSELFVELAYYFTDNIFNFN